MQSCYDVLFFFFSARFRDIAWCMKSWTRTFINLLSIVKFSKWLRQGVPYETKFWHGYISNTFRNTVSVDMPLTISLKQLFSKKKCSPKLCEIHKKRVVMEFFFGRHRLQLTKKGLHQRFHPVKFVRFFKTILSRTIFGECFCFAGWPCAAQRKQKVFDLAQSKKNNTPHK